MAWIEFHQSLLTHRKLYATCEVLGASENEVIGSLARFWCWALDNAPTGDLGPMRATVIAKAAGWTGDPGAYADALTEAGFLDRLPDGSLAIHDWMDYAGRLIAQREANAERMRNARAAHVQRTCNARAGATVPNRTQPNPTVPEVVTPQQQPANTDVTVTSPLPNTRPYPTVPNRTVPYSTAPATGSAASSGNPAEIHRTSGNHQDSPNIETPLSYYNANFGHPNIQQVKDLEDMEQDTGPEFAMAALRWAARNDLSDTGKIWDLAIRMKTEGIGKKPQPVRRGQTSAANRRHPQKDGEEPDRYAYERELLRKRAESAGQT